MGKIVNEHRIDFRVEFQKQKLALLNYKDELIKKMRLPLFERKMSISEIRIQQMECEQELDSIDNSLKELEKLGFMIDSALGLLPEKDIKEVSVIELAVKYLEKRIIRDRINDKLIQKVGHVLPFTEVQDVFEMVRKNEFLTFLSEMEQNDDLKEVIDSLKKEKY